MFQALTSLHTLVKGGNFEATKTDDSSKVLAAATGGTLESGVYTTKKGDTLWNISVRAYGDGFKWTKIYWENRKVIGNPDVIFADVKITIPVLK